METRQAGALRIFCVRHGSHVRDRSSPPARSGPVMLSAEAEALSEAKGKHLCAYRARP